MKSPKLRSLLTGLGMSSFASLVGAGVVAMDQLSGPDQYSTDYDLTRSIDTLIAPSAATLVGQYSALDAAGAALSDSQASIRASLTTRYRQIQAREHQGGTFEHLSTLEAGGFQSALSGHLSAEDVSGHARSVLLADQKIKDYAETTQIALGRLGLEKQEAQSVTAGMIGTELLSTDFSQDITPEGFIASAPFGGEVKAHLKARLPDLWEPFDLVNEASSMSYFKLQSRLHDAGQERPAPSALAAEVADVRPVARPDHEDRSKRIQERLHARLQEGATSDGRTSRIQQHVQAVAASRRPVARGATGPSEAEI